MQEINNYITLSLLNEVLMGGIIENLEFLENYNEKAYKAYKKKQYDKIQDILKNFKSSLGINENVISLIGNNDVLRYIIVCGFKNGKVLYGKNKEGNFILTINSDSCTFKPKLKNSLIDLIFVNAKFKFNTKMEEDAFKASKQKEIIKIQPQFLEKLKFLIKFNIENNENVTLEIECDNVKINYNDGIKPSIVEIMEGIIY